MRFLGQHELTGARQRFEARLREGRKLKFAIAVREHRKGKKVQPIIARLVERFENARLVRITTPAFQQSISFIATVATEIAVQQIDHGPEMPPLFNVDLK